VAGFLKGSSHESIGVSQENLPELQDHPAQARNPGHLQGSAAQATPRLIRRAL